MGTLEAQLAEAEGAAYTLHSLQEKASQVDRLRKELADRDRLARSRSVARESEEQARVVVADVGPQLEAWRVSFRDWTREGWRLLGELRTLESRLVPALDVAVAGAASLAQAEAGGPGDLERQFLQEGRVDHAVDQVLARVGASELDPFGDVPSGFPSDVVNVCLQWVGRVFVPRLGSVQFKRKGGGRPS